MRCTTFILVTILAVSGCATASKPKCHSADADGVVKALGPSKAKFLKILKEFTEEPIATRTAKFRGGSSDSAVIAKALDASAAKHHEAWELNEIAAWKSLSAQDLKKACVAINDGDSPSFRKIAEQVAPAIIDRNHAILLAAGNEVLEDIF